MSEGKVFEFDNVNKVKNRAKQAKGRHKVFLLLLLLALLALGLLLVKSEVQMHKLQSEKRMEENRNATLIRTKEDLQAELDSINTDEYIERLARRDLQLIKPNELLFILPEQHNYTSEETMSEDADEDAQQGQADNVENANEGKSDKDRTVDKDGLKQGAEDVGNNTEN